MTTETSTTSGVDGLGYPAVPVEAESGCRLCGQHIRLLLGQWTDPDGCISCPGAAGFGADHEPAEARP